MTPVGPRLIQPAQYRPGIGCSALVENASLGVRDRAGSLVERHPGHSDAAIADAAEDDPARDHLALVGRDRTNRSSTVRLQAVADDLHALHALLAEDRDG